MPDYKASKLLLDSAHDTMPYYHYYKRVHITSFITLNSKGIKTPIYKNTFTIDKDGILICKVGCRIHRDVVEIAKGKSKFKYPKIS